jgi:hypothetical protein
MGGKPVKDVKIVYGRTLDESGNVANKDSLRYNVDNNSKLHLPISRYSRIGLEEYKDSNDVTHDCSRCKIRAAYESDTYNRVGYGSEYPIVRKSYPNSLFNKIPSWAEDEDLLDLSKYYTNKITNEKNIAGTAVQQDSAFDVNKKYSITYVFTDGSETKTRVFYSPIKSPKCYTINGKEIWYAYRPVEYDD